MSNHPLVKRALRRPPGGRTAAATTLVALLLVSSCVGDIASMPGPGGGPPGGGGPNQNTPNGPIASAPGPSSKFLRLNHVQWENTVRDLLRLSQPSGLSKQFLAEPLRTTFDNSGGALEVSSQLWAHYKRAAEQLAKEVSRNAAQLALLVPKSAPADLDGKARAFIADFGRRTYRRPLAAAEVDQYLAVFKQGPMLVASADPFADGAELVLSLLLQSPHFIYRTELGAAPAGGKAALNDYEIASRLSYGLTNTMPDDVLFAAAEAKRLHTRDSVLAEAKRLLDTPAGMATVRNLHEQLLREVDPTDLVRDATLHPTFKPGMGADMAQESRLFVDEVLFARGGGLGELLTAPYTFVNARLAPFYGVTAPAGGMFARVDLNPAERAGLYTQLGFLAHTATDRAPQPILRGVHLNRHVLCVDIPPPPPNVDTMVPSDTRGLTNRKLYEQLTSASACQGCHGAYINPLGFAFESYDSLGRFRTMEGTAPIDTASSYGFAEGKRNFGGAVELMRIVAEGQQAHDCYAGQLFAYLYARDFSADVPADKALVAEIGRRSRLKASVKSLILDLIATDAFLYRLP